MSQRNFRKVYGAATIPPPSDGSEDEYEPLYVRNNTRSTYDGLEVSSSSDSEKNLSGDEESELESEPENARPPRRRKNAPRDDLDEIDRSVLEVNALLGEPSNAVVEPEPEPDQHKVLFSVQYKNLNPTAELNRMFGPDEEDEALKKNGRMPNFRRIQRSFLISKTFKFKGRGLYMTLDRLENGISYFVFNHSRDYQRRHKEFLLEQIQRSGLVVRPNDDFMSYMHIEALLEASDIFFRMENYTAANDLIEKMVAYMQFACLSSFKLIDINTRLEYKFIENRAFHIAVLKHMHLLSNRACHRTALELAKLLINLDPTDPLAVIFIIDTFAIRAREYQWLIDTVDYLDKERQASFLFNMKFSYALAHFHVAYKNDEDLSHADELLQRAIIAFPWIVKEIIGYGNRQVDDAIRNHTMFNSNDISSACMRLKQLSHLYVAFTGSWWSETPVFAWVMRNAKELVDRYENDVSVREDIERMEEVRNTLYPSVPREVKRHLSIIKYMSELLVEGAVPQVELTYSFDPHPPEETINRYGYGIISTATYLENTYNSVLNNFFASIHPNFIFPMIPDGSNGTYRPDRIIYRRQERQNHVEHQDYDTSFEESDLDTDNENGDHVDQLDSDDYEEPADDGKNKETNDSQGNNESQGNNDSQEPYDGHESHDGQKSHEYEKPTDNEKPNDNGNANGDKKPDGNKKPNRNKKPNDEDESSDDEETTDEEETTDDEKPTEDEEETDEDDDNDDERNQRVNIAINARLGFSILQRLIDYDLD